MLKLSKLADYGTVIMTYLARQPSLAQNAAAVAEATALGVPTVQKLLKLLTAAGLLQSLRGAKGGYRLSRPAAAISVAEIIEAIEHRAGLTQCSRQQGACEIEQVCPIRRNWGLIDTAIHIALDGVKLSHLAERTMPKTVVNVSSFKILRGSTRDGNGR